MDITPSPKPVFWVGSSQEDLRAFPAEVRVVMGVALYFAQKGAKHQDVRPLKGFGGASVLEVVEDYNTDTYRAVYTVRFSGKAAKHQAGISTLFKAACGKPRSITRHGNSSKKNESLSRSCYRTCQQWQRL